MLVLLFLILFLASFAVKRKEAFDPVWLKKKTKIVLYLQIFTLQNDTLYKMSASILFSKCHTFQPQNYSKIHSSKTRERESVTIMIQGFEKAFNCLCCHN